MAAKAFEYRVEWCQTGLIVLQACLDKYVNDGWGLHSVVLPHDAEGLYVIFERPVK